MRALSASRLAGVILASAAIAFASPSPALAAAPSNDSFADATVISSLPFSDTVDISEATTEPGEPPQCGVAQSVWYAFTPTSDAVVRADTAGSSFFETNLSIYRAVGPGLGDLSWLESCGQYGVPVVFEAQAGTTYYIQGGSVFGGGGTLGIHLELVQPPPNDDFANAIPITAVPFSDTQDITAATTEVGEPSPACIGGGLQNTVWYSFSPTTSESITVTNESSGGFSSGVAVYTGNSLASITELGCSGGGPFGVTFRAEPDMTYYFQAGGSSGGRGLLQVNVVVTPPPIARFFGPGPIVDPSIFDTVQFFDSSFDPAGLGIESLAWDFGDGTTATGCCPTHRYAADGDYTVQLTVTTSDGRTGSTSQVVQVRTHDVAITKFTVPKAASAGQTRQITVGVNSNRYPETVQVQLFKSVAGGGFQEISNLTKSVPVSGANRTTSFSFSYTFTSDDAVIGKVTFKAVANLVDARDALPADNEAIASPTKVSH